jgi:hypothetical protein
MHFFTFSHVRQIYFAHKFCVFDTFVDFIQQTNFQVILALFANFEAKHARNSSINKKAYFVNVSGNSILHPW